MIYGGKILPNGKIYFPASKAKTCRTKFAHDILHAPFYESACIGLVSTSCYSLRRGFNSALALISADALKVFLNGGHLEENRFHVAIECELNEKFYVGKFRILYS